MTAFLFHTVIRAVSAQSDSPFQTVCPSLKRRLTLDITARVTRIAGQSLKQGGRVVDQHSRAFVGIDTSKLTQCGCGRGGWSWRGRSLSRRDRHHGSGDAQARHQTCGQIPSTDVLLRGGADWIRALSADREALPRLHRGGPLAYPEEAWRSGEDEPAREGLRARTEQMCECQANLL